MRTRDESYTGESTANASVASVFLGYRRLLAQGAQLSDVASLHEQLSEALLALGATEAHKHLRRLAPL